MTINQYEFSQNPLDLTTFDTRKRWQLRPPPQFPAPWAVEWGTDVYGLWQTFAVKGIPLKMRYIPPGQFLMGSPENEPERADNERQHPVEITQGLWLAETTVTQALWRAVMGENPSYFNPEVNEKVNDTSEEELSVEQVSWYDCQQFFKQLNQLIPSLELTFPTEAQWEYACRAGSLTPFNTGENITTEQANFNGDSSYANFPKGEKRGSTIPVKSFQANTWGLYQMHGNVWEWCLDYKREYPKNSKTLKLDPTGPLEHELAALHGGCWIYDAGLCRSAFRYAFARDARSRIIGVRPCSTTGQQGQPEAARER
ncbi:formylglycine-generating enzyme family protein [Sessilibacter corallicola]|uniref:formylglycine-generating enzyme family protein n=1 Tax=Sessilibacter corallicola TaxID=2904075 RepID=UPI001E2A560D|nr:formylglycine-generating enzyme family protein [Sessilibacter corallicola]MCE2029335.1 formylglycine-generating enzyme family protein [Sessilibacter corallicola]